MRPSAGSGSVRGATMRTKTTQCYQQPSPHDTTGTRAGQDVGVNLEYWRQRSMASITRADVEAARRARKTRPPERRHVSRDSAENSEQCAPVACGKSAFPSRACAR